MLCPPAPGGTNFSDATAHTQEDFHYHTSIMYKMYQDTSKEQFRMGSLPFGSVNVEFNVAFFRICHVVSTHLWHPEMHFACSVPLFLAPNLPQMSVTDLLVQGFSNIIPLQAPRSAFASASRDCSCPGVGWLCSPSPNCASFEGSRCTPTSCPLVQSCPRQLLFQPSQGSAIRQQQHLPYWENQNDSGAW